MGLVSSLLLIDRSKLRRVISELKSHPFTSVEQVTQYIGKNQEGGFTTLEPEDIESDFSDLLEGPQSDLGRACYNSLLQCVVCEREWDLDKALGDRFLGLPIRVLPALKPLRFLVDFRGLDDLQLPRSLVADDSGLFGLWSSEYLSHALPPVKRFSDQDAVRDYASAIKWSMFDKVRGKPKSAGTAIEQWLEDWESWEQIR